MEAAHSMGTQTMDMVQIRMEAEQPWKAGGTELRAPLREIRADCRKFGQCAPGT